MLSSLFDHHLFPWKGKEDPEGQLLATCICVSALWFSCTCRYISMKYLPCVIVKHWKAVVSFYERFPAWPEQLIKVWIHVSCTINHHCRAYRKSRVHTRYKSDHWKASKFLRAYTCVYPCYKTEAHPTQLHNVSGPLVKWSLHVSQVFLCKRRISF